MDNKIFRQYTGSFFESYKFISVGSSVRSTRSASLLGDKPFKIEGNTIYVKSTLTIDQIVAELIPVLLKRENKTCLDLQMHMDGFVLSSGKTLPKSWPNKFLTNTANSCAIDSILFVLFFMNHSFFMDKIFSSKASETEKGQKFKDAVLAPLSELYRNNNLWSGTASKLQKLIAPFTLDKYGKPLKCTDVKSVPEIYTFFANAFPAMQFNYLSGYGGLIGNNPAKFTYLDFHDDESPSELTNHLSNFLVYADDRPAQTQSLSPRFGFTSDDYTLVGAIFFEGNIHYTSAIKTLQGWVYYDDLVGTPKVIKYVKNLIFNESPMHKVQMLFYMKTT